MTFSDIRYTAVARPTGAGVGAAGLIWKWIHNLVLADRRRRELHRLPDRVLADIGLHRTDIDGIAANLSDGLADVTRYTRGR